MSDAFDTGERRLIHKRQVECNGYLRPDGLWDIEGRLEDIKTHPVLLDEGRTVDVGKPYHGMRVRLTLDDEFTIREVEVAMPDVPTSECRGAAPGYQQLLGLRIGSGFTRRIKELFGKTRGCVHLTELLLPIATTAFQTIPMARSLVAPRDASDVEAYAHALVERVDTCHALRATGPIAARLLARSAKLNPSAGSD